MLDVNGITVRYGSITALHDVSFRVEQGEIVTLIGANGAGKTTCLHTISGLLPLSGGAINFMDQPISGRAPEDIVRVGIAHSPEGRRVFSGMTVQDNLEIGATPWRRGRDSMARPKLLLLDEPSLGLAPIIVEQLFDKIVGINQSGVTILLVEQNAAMALSVATRGYLLENGRVVLAASTAVLVDHPLVKEAYLGG
jgi:branched-chain amino acid transport system ATP-binding protein